MNREVKMKKLAADLALIRMQLIEAGLCETAALVGKAVEKVGWEISGIMTK